MTASELMEFYESNEDFHDYVEQFRRNHPELTVEQVLEKITVQEVAKFYMERAERK